ncbi:ACP S-malonyltransferase [Marinagarivorans algicola]|uniref:ACP S-malonyltransferase n=1 Tax=Marinagarivorans algicola TaxID=1513270 RepID=UPI0006B44A22|nr:ACP S-malonyltransferase [Marinagarivorans algicola]
MTDSTLAYVFPGQGSQSVGMLAELAAVHAEIETTYAQASTALGFDLWQLVQEGPQETLNLTQNAQPALLAASVALWRIAQKQGKVQPAVLAGHSLGEWSALVCAGVIEFTAAIKLVHLRGQYMQQAVPVGVGTMAAIIGLDDAAVEGACQKASSIGVVETVNYNSPGQLVIAGEAAAVEEAMALCKAAGAKRALPLPVSAPFHTSMMKPAADNLAKHIEQTVFNTPVIAVLHNVGVSVESDPEAIKQRLIAQIYSPVPWVASVNTLADMGVQTLVECGPGKVLSGLNKRINKTLTCLPLATLEALATQ